MPYPHNFFLQAVRNKKTDLSLYNSRYYKKESKKITSLNLQFQNKTLPLHCF